MLYQLSYEATHWEQGQFIEFISSRAVRSLKYIWNNSYLYCGMRWKWSVIIAVNFSNLSNWKVEAWKKSVQIWIISYIFQWSHCTGRNELNKLTLLPMCGFIAQLVEHRTGIAEVMGSNPVEALIFFFQASTFQLLKLEKFTAMITLHFHLIPQYKYELFHIYFNTKFIRYTDKG